MRQLTLLLALAAVGLMPLAGHAEDGQKRLQRLQKEKARLLLARQQVAKRRGSPLEIFQVVYQSIAKGNQKQYSSNLGIARKCQELAAVAEKKRLSEKRDKYLTLASIYEYYAKQNVKIVKAYKDFDSAAMGTALDEVEKIEGKIRAMGLQPADRDWFTIKELDKTALPGQGVPQASGSAPKGN